jgi:hypothetical protein
MQSTAHGMPLMTGCEANYTGCQRVVGGHVRRRGVHGSTAHPAAVLSHTAFSVTLPFPARSVTPGAFGSTTHAMA